MRTDEWPGGASWQGAGEYLVLESGPDVQGFTLMFTEQHPHAGGPDHYAAYLHNAEGFDVELVVDSPG